MNLFELIGRWVVRAQELEMDVERQKQAHRQTLELVRDLADRRIKPEQIRLNGDSWLVVASETETGMENRG